MIRAFRHRGLKRLFEKGDASRIRADLVEKVENILSVLDSASVPQALNLPGYRLHPLKGPRGNLWASRLTQEKEGCRAAAWQKCSRGDL